MAVLATIHISFGPSSSPHWVFCHPGGPRTPVLLPFPKYWNCSHLPSRLVSLPPSFQNHLFILYMCMHYMCCMCVTACVRRSEDKLWDLVLLTTWVPGMSDNKCLCPSSHPTCAFPAPFEAQRDRKLGETYYPLIQRDRVVLLCGGEERAETGISCTS